MRVIETAVAYGVDHLSDAQLVGMLLSRKAGDRAETVLGRAGGMGGLLQLGPADLRELGLTEREAIRVTAIPELLRRSNHGSSERPPITSPRAAGAYLISRCVGLTEEHFGLLALNAKGVLLAERTLSKGSASATLIAPREFFREALRYGATSAIAWHNHPSGDPTPSPDDSILTRRLRACGESLGVPLSDHLIVGLNTYHSFRAAEGWDQA
jgi:DNA repair protein RadC